VAVNPQLGTTSSFTVIVHEVNVAPELPVILTQTINKFAPLSVANAASEENIHATLAYGLVGAPSGMSINSSGLITWTAHRGADSRHLPHYHRRHQYRFI